MVTTQKVGVGRKIFAKLFLKKRVRKIECNLDFLRVRAENISPNGIMFCLLLQKVNLHEMAPTE